MARTDLTARMDLSMGQHMLLQPRMLQALEVLQLPALDLDRWLTEAAERNETLSVEVPERGRVGSWEDAERHDEMLRNQPCRPSTLVEACEAQLGLLDVPDELLPWARLCVDCLDEHGYLSLSDEALLALGAEQGLAGGPETLGRAIAVVQRLEPRGIGGRDLSEALLLQLDPGAPDYPLLCRLVEEFLDDVARNKLPAVARALGLEVAELDELLAGFRELDPRPGARLVEAGSPVVAPEVVVTEAEGGGFEVRLVRHGAPAVTIDPELAALARDPEQPREVRRYLREKLEQARWVVDAVAQREHTLLRVARSLFERQGAFLAEGPGHLAPLRMGALALELGLSTSTVSRAVAGKHAQTPHGIFALRHFFQAAAGGGEGSCARDDAREAVREVFAAEEPTRPLSDDEAVARLARRGLVLARRTVAKYRTELGIPSSYRRRRHA